MRSKCGRTGRRRKNKAENGSNASGESRSHEYEYIQLCKWLKERGFQNNYLRPVEFTDTGRGLATTQSLQPGELIISLPEKCLITTDTVLHSYLQKYIKRWSPPVSPLLALCTFLVTERHAGHKSCWKPYLTLLPDSYSCPAYWEDDIVSFLPQPVKQKAMEQKTELHDFYMSSLPFFKSLQPLFGENIDNILTYEALRWAWCTVNTRTVYMKHEQKDCFSSDKDIYALAPYLDLLNHSPGVQVEAAFNLKNRSYEVRTTVSCRKYEQVFICYGPHDNQRLLLEYGFVALNNPHQSVYVTKEVLLRHVSCKDKQMEKKCSLLQENSFLENLTFGLDGPSWRLLTVAKLLCLGSEEFMCWKKVLLGNAISESNEHSGLELVRKICLHLLEDTSLILKEISSFTSKNILVKKHLALVEALRLDELKILQTSADILENMHRASR
ncbi:SET domain-containing 4 isoform X1 [Pelobates cultripes]|uniref:SET domain-containing 4 isoform X1 n=2 Tax=Pelobates cultripes TaxID=61616 RepID=A0AAD1QWW1_PELCU|nr:SET domain-containing 4 isoform X1 [Pelobates cultripes]